MNNFDNIQERIRSVKSSQVEKALGDSQGVYHFEKLISLVSPAASKYLEQMAQIARRLTLQRFGRIVQLYAPLYVSNYCVNNCAYCAYHARGDSHRCRLTVEQALAEASVLAQRGFRHILIVSGEDKEFISINYLCELAHALKKNFSSVSIEIYPCTQEEYRTLFTAGVDQVTIYQETYDRQDYAKYHRAGPKSDYDQRLDTPRRAAAAGMRKIGLGVLLGLSDWRIQTLYLAEHADWLIRNFWQTAVEISFPRLCPAENVSADIYEHLVNDIELAQMIFALRLCFADVQMVLSTRESAKFRDNMIDICITKISAGSSTSPGGYTATGDNLEQFQINDDRSPAEVAAMLCSHGREPVWKDWDKTL